MEYKNRLQFVHCDTLFTSSAEAQQYVLDTQYNGRYSLYAEPMIVKYKTASDKEPNIILAIGSVGDGVASASNKIYFIDTATLNKDIQQISGIVSGNTDIVEYIKEELEKLKKETVVSLNDSNTITFIKKSLDNDLSGKTYQANIKLCDYNDNILYSHNDGLYGTVDLTFDKSLNKLTFKRSHSDGTTESKDIQLESAEFLKNAYYDATTDEIVFEFVVEGQTTLKQLRVPIRGLIEEWDVDNTNSTITLKKIVNTGTTVDKLIANVNIADNVKNNILKKTNTDNGYALEVLGTADNIYYDENYNVQTKIKSLDNFNVNINEKTNVLSSKTESLSGIVKDLNASTIKLNNDLIDEKSERKLADTQIQTNIDNEASRAKNSELNLQTSITSLDNKLTHVDSDLNERITSNTLNIDKLNTSANTLNTNILNETNRANQVEVGLVTAINTESTRAQNSENILTTNLNTEKTDRITSDNVLQNNIDSEKSRAILQENNLQSQITSNKIVVEDTKTIDLTLIDNKIKGDVQVADTTENIIKISESGIYAKPSVLSYEPSTNILTYTDGNGKIMTAELAGAKILGKGSHYDDVTKSLILVFVDGSSISIPMQDLISEWTTGESTTHTISLNLAHDATSNKNILTADAELSNNIHNVLTISGNGLFVSDEAKYYKLNDGTVNIQDAYNNLVNDTATTNTALIKEKNDREVSDNALDVKITNVGEKSITAITTAETNTVSLTTGKTENIINISANIKKSTNDGNVLEVRADGLYVSNTPLVTFDGDFGTWE